MKAEAKKCSKCGEPFYCFANTGIKCWCEDIIVSEQILKQLQKEYEDCLCPKCLAEYSGGC